jgi:hypothetical protein
MRARSLAHLRLLLGGLAASGVVAAHLIAYFLAEPDPHAREDLLAATGHHRWTLVVAITLGFTVAGLVHYAWARALSPHAGKLPGGALFRLAAGRLIPMQVLGCVGLEAVERWFAGQPVATVLTEPAVMIGVFLQLLVAVVGALILVLFARAIDLILGRRVLLTFSAPRTIPRPILHVLPPRFQVAAGSGTLRGPPLVD